MSVTQLYEVQLKGEALKSYPVCNFKTKQPGLITLLNRFNAPILTFNPADILVFRKVGDVVKRRGDSGKPRTLLSPEVRAKVIAFSRQGMVSAEIIQENKAQSEATVL